MLTLAGDNNKNKDKMDKTEQRKRTVNWTVLSLIIQWQKIHKNA